MDLKGLRLPTEEGEENDRRDGNQSAMWQAHGTPIVNVQAWIFMEWQTTVDQFVCNCRYVRQGEIEPFPSDDQADGRNTAQNGGR